MKHVFRLAIVIAAFLCTLQAQAQLQFFPLGDLPGGVSNSAAYGVSGDGSVVVGSSVSSTGVTAFMWTEGGGLVALPMLSGGTSATAYATSSDGSVIVGGSDSASGPQACVWSNGTVNGLGDLGGGAFESVAKDVSDDGSVIVGYGTSASGREAFRHAAGTMTGLGDLAGGSFKSEARAVTPDGSLVTGYGTVSGDSIFTWDAVNGLSNYYNSAQAYDVSSDGMNLAGYIHATYFNGIQNFPYRRAARWNNGSVEVIGPENSSGLSYDSLFYGLTPDAAIAVGSYRTTQFGAYFAVSHDSVNNVRNLRDELLDDGVDVTNWTLTAATAISADGSVIVGYGTNPDGNTEAWIIKGYGLDLQLRWVGNNAHWPANDALTDADDLYMNIDSKDQGIGVTGIVVYTTDKGETWTNAPLIEGTPGPDYDHWYQNLGMFPAGTTIRYSLAVEDAEGYQLWDNNQGRDYYAVVAPGYTGTVEWIGNDVGATEAYSITNIPLEQMPGVSITLAPHSSSQFEVHDLVPGYDYEVQEAYEMGTNWYLLSNGIQDGIQPASQTNHILSTTNWSDRMFYRVRGEGEKPYVDITREVWPQDSGKAARLGYRIGAGDWMTVEMNFSGATNNNDVWTSRIGPVMSGSTVEYFIEVISAANGGFPHYDNNDNNNYSVTVP